MGCGCGGGKKRTYVVTTASGEKKKAESLSGATQIVRREGGSYEIVRQ